MKKTLDLLSEYAQIILGILLASIGLKAFLLPNGFLDGGVTGIAILISELTDYHISWLLLLISIPCLVMAWLTLSRRIVYKSILSIISLAIFIHFENFAAVTEDKLLISIFGGLFLGAGIGLTIKNGAVLDGSEILGIFMHDRYGLSIGRVILAFNVVLFIITAIILSMEVAMYSVLTYLVTAKVIDFLIEGFEDYVGLMIVSAKNQALEKQLIKDVGTGMTIYKGSRGYGSSGKQQDMDIIHLVINRIDIRKTYNAINKTDKNAFIIEFDVNNIKGGVLRKYLSKEGFKELSPTIYENQ
jgi:uncharacterized membrane-anchored protein YitT (DUF2179 family)